MSNDPKRALVQRVLLINDDGYGSAGLHALETVCKRLADEIWVVAPLTDQSGVSISISLHGPTRYTTIGSRHYAVIGTPADCAVLAIGHLMEKSPPDLVISGINHGSNVGVEALFSGTLGGAMMATLLGVQAIALSQPTKAEYSLYSPETAEWIAEILRKLLIQGWSSEIFLNVNLPRSTTEPDSPFIITSQARGKVSIIDVEARTNPRGLEYHWFGFRPEHKQECAKTDVAAIESGCVSVTPMICAYSSVHSFNTDPRRQ